ncbi:hypothetical protein BCR43DRAFT_526032 [Syncephalastrum racemosum]|uniref:Uncharacterized protein n=1 Tax=Syncephalastrum racemosum TaxID=13706 RepID=A0A1X2H8N9_SYNRA|nr:hypothetical protein BCR43DRAFT_526032 [Syncephalastrum racemosum]
MATQTESPFPSLVSSPTHIWTLHDVILDTPVWKANILHLEEQVDHFEKWVEGFTKALRQYMDAVTKYNAQTANLCRKTLPQNLDGSLIDPQVAGMIINNFASTLQCNLAFKTKLISDLDDTLLRPLQQFVGTELKEFKHTRRSFEKTMEKYQSQMNRYAALSRTKEPSALREDAFQTYDMRKQYTQACRVYYMQLVQFKANLEHTLVECFSGAMGAQIDETEEANQSCMQPRAMLPGWQQWLDESKETSAYQLKKIDAACQALEDYFLDQIRPHRSLKNYTTKLNRSGTPFNETYSSPDLRTHHPPAQQRRGPDKEGYLFVRTIVGIPSRYSWARRWCFLKDGWFGTCTTANINRVKGCIVVSDRLRTSEAVCLQNNELDRRFCFDIEMPGTAPLVLQAETEEELLDWMQAFEASKIETEMLLRTDGAPSALLAPNAIMTLVQKKPALLASSSPLLGWLPRDVNHLPGTTTTACLISVMLRYVQDESMKRLPPLNDDDVDRDSPDSGSKAVSPPSSTTPSGTPPSHGASTMLAPSNTSSSSWSMPWIMSALNGSSPGPAGGGSGTDVYYNSGDVMVSHGNSNAIVVWPTGLELEAGTPQLNGYTGELQSRQRELHKLFDNVPRNELVLEAFPASMYRKAEAGGDGSPGEFGYNGHVYLTQTRLWFYSCTLMSFVNTLVVPLTEIKSVSVERPLNSTSQAANLIVETDGVQRFCFGIWLESAELVCERLKIAYESAKSAKKKPIDVQTEFDLMRSVVPGRNKLKAVNRVTPASAIDAAVTPLTVQAMPSPKEREQEILRHDTDMQRSSSSPATGALTAAIAAHNSSSTPPPPPPQTNQEDKQTEGAVEEVKSEPVTCPCPDHLDEVVARFELRTSAKRVFEYMFSEKLSGPHATHETLWGRVTDARGNSDLSVSSWCQTKDAKQERTLKYVMPVEKIVARSGQADVIETQEIEQEDDGRCYVVICRTKTPDLAYADAFIPLVKYCITALSAEKCLVTCSIGIKWLRSIMVKSMVRSAAFKGMNDTVATVKLILERHERYLAVPGGTTKLDSIKAPKTPHPLPPAPRKVKKDTFWLNIGQMAALVGVVLVACLIVVWKSPPDTTISLQPTTSCSDNQNANATIIHSHAVFLRDLDTLSSKPEGSGKFYIDFQRHRGDDPLAWRDYTWFDARHRLMAAEMTYTRHKLGSLRLELLNAFGILNAMERRVIENEYWNWLSDERLRCADAPSRADLDCKEVEQEELALRSD